MAMLVFSAPSAPAAAQKTAPVTPVAPYAAPAFSYNHADVTLPFDASRHRLTILHFWATWCVPCLEEIPQLDAVSKTYHDRGLQVVPLSLDDHAKKVDAFYAKHNITHLAVDLDSGNAAFAAVKARGLPYTLFVNQQGQVIATGEGPVDWQSEATLDFIEQQLR